MKLKLILKKQHPDLPNYLPGYIFEVTVDELTISAEDPNVDGLTLEGDELDCFRLLPYEESDFD